MENTHDLAIEARKLLNEVNSQLNLLILDFKRFNTDPIVSEKLNNIEKEINNDNIRLTKYEKKWM